MPALTEASPVHETVAPVIPTDEAKGHSGLVVDCPPHALPFGIIFEEYIVRRRDDLERNARRIFSEHMLSQAVPGLRDWQVAREAAYLELAQTGGNLEDVPRVAAELERIVPAALASLPEGASATLIQLLEAREVDSWEYAQMEDKPEMASNTEFFGVLAIEVCRSLLPDPIVWLRKWLQARNETYHALADAKQKPDTPLRTIDKLERACSDYDRPLKRLLHKMNGSAVCLSGGGIRSASFSLGVLEGLARFSLGKMTAQRGNDGDEGLLQNIDYLSTVSGGGYIGSWLSAWIYRRWQAEVKVKEPAVDVSATTAAVMVARTALQEKEAALKMVETRFAGLKKQADDLAASQAEPAQANADRASGVDSPPSAGQTGNAKLDEAEAAYEQARNELEDAYGECYAASLILERAKAACWKPAYKNVVKALAGDGSFTSGDPAPQPIRHLRDYTSYLAPAMGLSLDFWDLLAIVCRNMLINWVMLAPLLLTLVALPQISYFLSHALAPYLKGYIALAPAVLVMALFVAAANFCEKNLPSHQAKIALGPSPGWVMLRFVAPVLLADWLIAELWYANQDVGLSHTSLAYFVVLVISAAGFSTLANLFYRDREGMVKEGRVKAAPGRSGTKIWVLMQGAGLVCALVTTELLATLALYIFPALAATHATRFGFTANDRLYTILAFPLVSLVPMVSHSLFSGLLGIFEQEEDREWMSRGAGVQLAVVAVWVLAHAIALYSTDALAAIKLGFVGALMGGAGSALGWSGTTAAGERPVKQSQLGKVGSFLSKHDLLLPILCAAALLLITLGAGGVEQSIASRLNSLLYQHFEPKICSQPWYDANALLKLGNRCHLWSHLIVLAGFAALALLVNWAIDVNLFSLHGMYRMRLMRAFLGASNTQRDPDHFTQFDPEDTPLVVNLGRAPDVPIHVVNTTLNLVGTKNLAWRQRKAESFTFTALHSGAWRLAYAPTKDYAGAEGVSLATAMTISGAAFNPNMGYHSSPLVTLLMTFFNVRLGWWLPNPVREGGARHALQSTKGAEFLHKSGPTIALEPLILEAFGMTDDTYRWIELTDGGHFENLGLYEMVLRRCHNIVVVDAGADPDCQFEDLGNALRKIEIDLGIPIRFPDGIKMDAGAVPANRYCAVAKIDYGCVDDCSGLSAEERGNLAGTLIYVKAAITGGEPPDIRQYSLTHSTFPHETTANQFFNESQFESYRHLGSFEIETIVSEGVPGSPLWWGDDLAEEERIGSETPLGCDFASLEMVATNYTQA